MWKTVAISTSMLAAGCAVTTPAPMLMHHESVIRRAPGAVTLTAFGGGGGGVFVDEFGAGGANIDVQATDEVSLGLGAGAGREIGDGESDGAPDWIAFGRAFGSYRPAKIDWFALNFGVGGGGADTGLSYVTADLGVSFGYTFDDRVRPYAGLAFAMSVPVDRGPPVGGDAVRPTTTAHGIIGAGMAVRLAGNLEFSFEGSLDLGWAANDEKIAAGALTWGLKYTFGGPLRRDGEPPETGDPEPLGVRWVD